MMVKIERLQRLLTPTIEGLGYEWLGCELSTRGHCSLVKVYIDQPQGVTLEDCAKVSRQISAVLDVTDSISGRYNLQVSSPGIERPLFTLAHYQRYVGRELRLRLKVARDGQRNYRGVIKTVEAGIIMIESNDRTLQLRLSEIDKANLTADCVNRGNRA